MKKGKFFKPWVLFVLLVVTSLACSSTVTVYETSAPPNVETLVAETLVVLTENAPKATNTPIATATSIRASATPENFGEVYVYTTVENVNLRTNPGLLFTVSRVMAKNTKLRLLGKSPGGEWLYVMNAEDISGLVNSNVVLAAYDGPPPPIIEPTNVLLVTGDVMTELGTPVSGVGFAVYQGSRRTDAITNSDGQFYAYLPANMSGTWAVEYSSIACTSNTMDSNCNCISGFCGIANPTNAMVQLPQLASLHFIWK
jgi:hypothetical protein